MYTDCKIYGPYTSEKDGRKRIIAKFSNGKQQTISYPKYLMELHLGRYLLPNETVDHIDCDFTNDELSNLRVIDRKEHIKQDALRNKSLTLKCPLCKESFCISGKNYATYSANRRKGKVGPFCSRQCAGKYGAFVQNDYIAKLPVEAIIPAKKFRLKDDESLIAERL